MRRCFSLSLIFVSVSGFKNPTATRLVPIRSRTVASFTSGFSRSVALTSNSLMTSPATRNDARTGSLPICWPYRGARNVVPAAHEVAAPRNRAVSKEINPTAPTRPARPPRGAKPLHAMLCRLCNIDVGDRLIDDRFGCAQVTLEEQWRKRQDVADV